MIALHPKYDHTFLDKIIRPAKFWTFCNLAILLLLVLLQTVEQYSSLLKTKEFITNKSVFSCPADA